MANVDPTLLKAIDEISDKTFQSAKLVGWEVYKAHPSD